MCTCNNQLQPHDRIDMVCPRQGDPNGLALVKDFLTGTSHRDATDAEVAEAERLIFGSQR